MKKLSILVTGVGSFVSNSILSNFKIINDQEIRIIGCDIKDYVSSYNLLDKYYKIPSASNDNFIDELYEIACKENIDVIVPLVDFEIEKIANNIDKFKDFKMMMINPDEIEMVLNKGKLFDFLEINNIAVPKYYKAKNYKEFIKACKNLNYKKNKICFKPVISSGSRGFRIIDNSISEYDLLFDKPNSLYIDINKAKQILKTKKQFPELLIMEYLPNDLYTVHILSENGKINYIVICKVIKELSSNMIESEIVYDNEVRRYCENITSLLNLTGIFGIEVKRDKNNIIKMLEINPRIQGSIAVCNAVGINLPYLAIKQLYNEKLPIIEEKKTVRIIRSYQENYIIDENK